MIGSLVVVRWAMDWQPARLTRAQLEERRVAAAKLLQARELSEADIARRLGVSRAAVTQWKQCLEQMGLSGLQQHRPSGRAPRLNDAQWNHLLQVLQRGAGAAEFDTERWTLPRIAAVVERT